MIMCHNFVAQPLGIAILSRFAEPDSKLQPPCFPAALPLAPLPSIIWRRQRPAPSLEVATGPTLTMQANGDNSTTKDVPYVLVLLEV